MNRRRFLAAATLGAAAPGLAIAQEKEKEKKKKKKTRAGHGACGLSCAGCRMHLIGRCAGCGDGGKAECPILQCAKIKELSFCAQCKGYPCPKIRDSGKFGDAWLDKMAKAPVPEA